ncbi:MAG: uroporphyrinogen-III synthase [Campylobacterota bacterium]
MHKKIANLSRNIYLTNSLKFDNTINLDVFKIAYLEVKNLNLDKYDALIFTSKNAIYSLDKLTSNWKNKDSYVIASKTADTLEQLGGKLKFVGQSGHGNEFAYELLHKLKNKKALYIKAKKTVSSLLEILKENGIDVDSIITYETVCKKSSINIEDNSIIIFTSPSSVECFFKNYNWNDTCKAVVIGKTTAKYLPKYIEYFISEETSVQECVKLAFKL